MLRNVLGVVMVTLMRLKQRPSGPQSHVILEMHDSNTQLTLDELKSVSRQRFDNVQLKMSLHFIHVLCCGDVLSVSTDLVIAFQFAGFRPCSLAHKT